MKRNHHSGHSYSTKENTGKNLACHLSTLPYTCQKAIHNGQCEEQCHVSDKFCKDCHTRIFLHPFKVFLEFSFVTFDRNFLVCGESIRKTALCVNEIMTATLALGSPLFDPDFYGSISTDGSLSPSYSMIAPPPVLPILQLTTRVVPIYSTPGLSCM